MKTIITSSGNQITAPFDLRFGRAAWFCLLDEETGAVEFFENEFKDANSGAGKKAAEKVINLGAKKIISGDFGPKSKDLLDKFQIQLVVIQDENQSVQDIIQQLITTQNA